ncbi:MAG TPA: Wzz/FepE/Etk N-terminal domain-containing protein [Terracidiphilus sp.]|nr:Wzz/FepE/Etk N-terminal domain-containing protein [Terracidiphilus sp.]
MAIKRRKLVGIAALTIVVLGSAVALLLPSRYVATTVILPPQQGGSAGSAMMAQLSNLNSMTGVSASALGLKNPNDLQVSLLKSRTIEDAMVARFHLQALYNVKRLSSARKKWEKKTYIDNGLKDGLIRLSVTDRDPRRAAEMANGWVEEYRRLSANLAVNEASGRRLFFERQVTEASENLARSEEEMKQTEQRTGVMEMDGQAHAMIAAAAVLRAQVAAKKVEIQAMRQFAAEENPDLERAQQELSSLEAQLAAMDVAHDRFSGDLVAPKGTVSQAGLEYARALREVKYRETVVGLLMRLQEVARVDEARQGAQAQIVDAAVVPDRPASQFRIWIVLGALLVSLPLALALALATEAVVVLRILRRRAGSWTLALEDAWGGGAR